MLNLIVPYLRHPAAEDEALAAVREAIGTRESMRVLRMHLKRPRLRQKPGRAYRWDLRAMGEALGDVWIRLTGRSLGRRNNDLLDSRRDDGPFPAFLRRVLELVEPPDSLGERSGVKLARQIHEARRDGLSASCRSELKIWCASNVLAADTAFITAFLDPDHPEHASALRRWHTAIASND